MSKEIVGSFHVLQDAEGVLSIALSKGMDMIDAAVYVGMVAEGIANEMGLPLSILLDIIKENAEEVPMEFTEEEAE